MAAFWRSGWRLVARPGNLRLAGALLARDSWPSTGALPSCVHRRRGGGEWRGRGLSSSAAPPEGGMRLVYTGPLKGAVRAVKVFSLSTCVLALMGTPVLVVLGNPGVPVPARVAMGSLVLLVGVSTTAVLHWLCKGYITRLFYDKHSHTVAAYTVSLFGLNKKNVFEVEALSSSTFLSLCPFHSVSPK